MISLIVARGLNGEIGKDNKLLWRLSSDLRKFKATTMGKSILMGRKTFESIGKALPGRTNYILTRNQEYNSNQSYSGIEVIHNIKEIKEGNFVICGGSQIYKELLERAEIVYISQVQAEFEADSYFAELDKNHWKLISSTPYPQTDKDEYPWSFQVWKKRSIKNS